MTMTVNIYTGKRLQMDSSITVKYLLSATQGRISRRITAIVLAAVFAVFPMTAPASVVSDLAASMLPGEWKEVPQGSSFGGGSIFIPAGGSGNLIEYMVEAQRNPFTKKIYLIGCAKGAAAQNYRCGSSTTDPDAKFVVYDEATNSWAEMPSAPISTFPHTYDHAALDPDTGDYYFREDHNKAIWRYTGGQWIKLPPAPNLGSEPGSNAAEFFPELGGLVVPNPRNNSGEIYLYTVASNSWSIIPDDFAGDSLQFTEYNPVHKFLYFGGGLGAESHLYKLGANKKVTRLADAPAPLGIADCASLQATDPLTGKLVVFSCPDNSTYEYDPSSNSWKKTGTHALVDPFNRLRAASVPLNDYGVIFVAVNTSDGKGKIYLYKHTAGSPPPPDTTPPAVPSNSKVK